LLAIRLASVIGWYETGLAWVSERDCRQAAAAFGRANDLIRSGADPEELSVGHDIRAGLQREMQRVLEACR